MRVGERVWVEVQAAGADEKHPAMWIKVLDLEAAEFGVNWGFPWGEYTPGKRHFVARFRLSTDITNPVVAPTHR